MSIPNTTSPSNASPPKPVRYFHPLSTRKFNTLLALVSRYRDDAEKATKARAYYAACITLGAALEGLLLSMCTVRDDEVETYIANLAPSSRPRNKNAERWDLNDLLPIAIGLRWLPARANKFSRTRLGDWAHLVQEFRDFVHPGRHVRKYPNVRLVRGHWRDAKAIFDLAVSSVLDLVKSDLRADMRRRGIIPLD